MHILIDHAIRQNCLDLATLEPVKGNTYMHYLFSKIGQDFLILDDREIVRLNSNQNFRFNGSELTVVRGRLFGEYVLLKGLLSSGIRKITRGYAMRLEEKYTLLKARLLTNPDRLFILELISLRSTTKLFLFKYVIYNHFFSKRNFRTVTSIDENSARIKTILDAAKANDMTAIGIQHGTIHELHPAYLFTPNDISLGIIPNFTMVWGNYWSNFLQEKGNYPERSLVTTGQIRTDIIPRLKETKLAGSPEIAGKGRMVVFASQPQRDPVIREKAAFDVFTAVNNIPNAHLVLKLHPAEKNDVEYYRKIATKAGCTNYHIILKIDLYLLISLSDLMITCFSTVGAETVYFYKPLIILDHLKQDIQGYHREGIALQAANVDELEKYIKQFLDGEIKINKEAYKNYIEKYAYRIDGKVSERMIEIIRGLRS